METEPNHEPLNRLLNNLSSDLLHYFHHDAREMDEYLMIKLANSFIAVALNMGKTRWDMRQIMNELLHLQGENGSKKD